MPVTPTYPGVYVEEIPSGVRTITGVATSITAFLGRAVRGPVDSAQTIFSFSDYERLYGGLRSGFPMAYAVHDFFLNGGGQAVIVRLTGTGSPILATSSPVPFTDDELKAGQDAITAIFKAIMTPDNKPVAAPIAAAEGERVQQVATAVALMHTEESNCQARQTDLVNATRDLETARAACANTTSIAQQLETLLIASPADATLKEAYQGAVARREQCEHQVDMAQAANDTATTALRNAQESLDRASRIAQVVRLAGAEAVRAVETALGNDPFKLPTPSEVLATALQGNSPAVASSNARAATAQLGGLTLVTRDEGAWGNELRAKLEPSSAAQHYILTIGKPGEPGKDPLPVERLDYLVADKGSPRNIAKVVERGSGYVTVQGEATELSPRGWTPFLGGSDGGMLKSDGYEQKLATVLDAVDLFNLLCIPPDQDGGDVDAGVYQEAMTHCARRRAMLIVDPPAGWKLDSLVSKPASLLGELGLSGPDARNAILFFPRVRLVDQLGQGQERIAVPCGIITGVIARTDRERGVWKAPAGTDAALSGIRGLQYPLTDDQNGQLTPLGVNCLRTFPIYGTVIWGARTMRGADQFADEYKYIPVRRLALYIEESLYRGLKWVVFEPNDEPLWAQIRLNVGAFMHNLFRQGAFQGRTPREAYFVKCDKETTTKNDINLGIVNIVVGFAPLKPAEFVIVKLQQMAGQIAV